MIPRIQLKQPTFNSKMMRRQPQQTGRISMMLPMSPTARRLQKMDNARGTLAKKRYPYQDFDHDGVMNKFDCQPYNRNKQGIKEALGAVKTGASFVVEKTSAGARVVAGNVVEGARAVGRASNYIDERYEKYKAEKYNEEKLKLSRKLELEQIRAKIEEEKKASLLKERSFSTDKKGKQTQKTQYFEDKERQRPKFNVNRSSGGSLFRAEPRESGSYNPTASSGYFNRPGQMTNAPPYNPYLKHGFSHAPIIRQQMAAQTAQQTTSTTQENKKQGLKKGGRFITRRIYVPNETNQS